MEQFHSKLETRYVTDIEELAMNGRAVHAKTRNPDARTYVAVLGSNAPINTAEFKYKVKSLLQGKILVAGNQEDIVGLMNLYNQGHGGPPAPMATSAYLAVISTTLNDGELRRTLPGLASTNTVSDRPLNNVRSGASLIASSKAKVDSQTKSKLVKEGIFNCQEYAIEALLHQHFVLAEDEEDAAQRVRINGVRQV